MLAVVVVDYICIVCDHKSSWYLCLQEKPNYSEAEQIRMSMFSFGGPEESSEFRGRGRGRGRGRSRGGGGGGRRGRARGRFG